MGVNPKDKANGTFIKKFKARMSKEGLMEVIATRKLALSCLARRGARRWSLTTMFPQADVSVGFSSVLAVKDAAAEKSMKTAANFTSV